MLFTFIFLDSAGNATVNWAIVAFIGVKVLIANGNAVGGSDVTEVVAGG